MLFLQVKYATEFGLSLKSVQSWEIDELALKLAYAADHGTPQARLEFILANGLALVANASGNLKNPVSAKDLLPNFETPKEVDTKTQAIALKAWVKMWNKAQGKNGRSKFS